MKILLNFDKAVADVLSDKVKSRLTFKVRRASHVMRPSRGLASTSVLTHWFVGTSRYLPLLRRRLDLHYQGHQLQVG
ncbi:hypothetical protein LEMA_P034700.1 [Plenodomus lingam JN3]|uniref:Uncharacterized protein n=1 Tax=Leptosphaeria maculans (strain JN3 / isolate v23.1.3 / race Av1-4-5-6-7-8) TaxID=985895 RepID=E4ZRD1_LEPMJ|nr:hypothetical protein LEMA_P034700.1 [Plenodomus lingam JN3]CBX93796.1 hypothetical protein LEMA_P034700.1 [Plenodomus lingam JN3]